jgi:hypothetical protein
MQAQHLLSSQLGCSGGMGEATGLFLVGAWLLEEANVDLIFS